MSKDALAVQEVRSAYAAHQTSSFLPEGYTLTEVGIIPADWKVMSLGGLEPYVTSGSRGWARYYSNIGDLFVRITNMTRETIRLDLSDVRHVSLPALGQEGARTSLNVGDVLVSITADIGIVSYIDDSVPQPAYINQHIALVRLSEEFVCARFVALFLSFGQGQKRFRAITDQGAKAGINLGTVKSVPVALPPTVQEQRCIASALGAVDALLQELDRLIAKKRNIKQATMQQLLTGTTRLPGFEGEWSEKSLLEIADHQKTLFDDGDWIESEHITDQGVRLVQTGNIGEGIFIEKSLRKYIFEESFEKLRCKELQVGDILICRLAEPAGRACILPEIDETKVITSVDITIFRPRPDVVNRHFLVQFFSTNDWFKAVQDNVGGTTHKRISRGALGKLEVPLPSVEEQNAIASVLVEMDKEIQALERRRSKVATLKKAMMQDLLTGRTRLS